MVLYFRMIPTFVASLGFIMVLLGHAAVGTAQPSQVSHILKQLEILEKEPDNLRPEQRRAIQNIRAIIERYPGKIAAPPPHVVEPCKREMINNEDGTFTFVIETERELQAWLLPVNSNEFNQGMNWHDARERVKEYNLNGIRGWKLPPVEVLYGIHKVSSECPSKLAKVTGAPIIRGQFYHFAYWTSNEFSFVDATEKYHADAVSLYSGNVIHERKENIGILWPAKLISKESMSDIKKKELPMD